MKKNPPVDKVLNLVLKRIREGCRSIDSKRRLDAGIDDLFKRRYRLTFEERLAEEGSWARDKDQVLKAAKMHGVIAAAAAQFSPPGRITQGVFMKAAHVIEVECYEYVTAGQQRRRQRNQPLFGGAWCW
jgi:hypothetical protein